MSKASTIQRKFESSTSRPSAPGTTDWWNSVTSASEHFRNPHREGMVFSSDWLSQNDIKIVLTNLLQEANAEKSLRLYVGGGLRPDALGRLLTRAPRQDETIEEWGAEMMQGEEYGLVINNTEQFHPELSKRLARFFHEPMKALGMPPGGIEVGCFLGNYSQSPFGVHHDRDQSVVFHLQIGPGDKTMWCWSHDDYIRCNGNADSCFEWEHLKHCASEIRFGPGDFYVLPCEGYHIGQSSGFSMGLAVAFVDLTQQQQFEKALATMGKRLVKNFSRQPQPNRKSLVEIDFRSSRPYEASDKDSSFQKQERSFEDLLSEADLDNQCRQWSNQGFHHHCDSVLRQFAVPAEIDAFRIVAPFPLVFRQATMEGLKLYARGHCFSLPAHPRFIDAVQKINNCAIVRTHELIETLAPDWPAEWVLRLVQVLVEHQALEVVDSNCGSGK